MAGLICLVVVLTAGCSSSGTVERMIAEDSGDVVGVVEAANAAESRESGEVPESGEVRESGGVSESGDVGERREVREPRETRRKRRRNEKNALAEADTTDIGIEGDPATETVEPVVPEEVLTAYEQAVAALAAGDWIEAELQLEQFVAEHGDYPGPYVNLAIVYGRDGRTGEAREALERALAIDPDHAAANNQLGIALREAGEFEAAEEAYRRAIEREPSYALAHYNLAVLLDLYFRRGDEALAAYETYQALVTEPDTDVGRWIVDLRRRVGAAQPTERVAQESTL